MSLVEDGSHMTVMFALRFTLAQSDMSEAHRHYLRCFLVVKRDVLNRLLLLYMWTQQDTQEYKYGDNPKQTQIQCI